MATDLRPAADRFVTERPGSTTWHSFSFGDHYDPANVSFGPVVAVNEELLEVGAGFEEHEHRDLVIVTYVVSGSLAHQGISSHVLQAGEVGVFTTGRASVHAERNAGDVPARFVQTWLAAPGREPSYEVASGPVVVGGWRFSVASEVDAEEAHVFEVPSGDCRRLTPPGGRVTGDVLLVTERVRD